MTILSWRRLGRCGTVQDVWYFRHQGAGLCKKRKCPRLSLGRVCCSKGPDQWLPVPQCPRRNITASAVVWLLYLLLCMPFSRSWCQHATAAALIMGKSSCISTYSCYLTAGCDLAASISFAQHHLITSWMPFLQVLEVETFIPMVLQRQEDGIARLKRVILIGDHHQLPPVVQNMAFQKYSHFDQSLFARFIRLGTPYVELNAQVGEGSVPYCSLLSLPSAWKTHYLLLQSGFSLGCSLLLQCLQSVLLSLLTVSHCSWEPCRVASDGCTDC